ncbi:MAG: hypothetical protein NT015_09885 [Alphaproteobacteria bacterium]|nr:hypothetical protein [Alphaproteobacteria bacterium]
MNPYSDFSVPWFDAFLLWLSATDLREFFYRFEDFDWLFVFAHVASAAVLLGSILIVDLRIIGVMREISLRKLARLALPWSIGGAIIALLSGSVLLLFDPIAVGVHTYFLPKMGLILLGLLNAIAFHRLYNLDVAETPSARTRLAGVLSIALWAGVFLCASLNGTERISSTSHAELTH